MGEGDPLQPVIARLGAFERVFVAGFESRRAGERAIYEVETLRNRLAHSHPVRPEEWDAIVILSSRLNGILERVAGHGG